MDYKALKSGTKRKHVSLTTIKNLELAEHVENGVSGEKQFSCS
jgi:hypothetical protein